MRRFYLDTHVFSYLVDPNGYMASLNHQLSVLLKTQTIEIFGPLELLGEFVPLASTKADAYRRLVDKFWSFCGLRMLRPWNELIRAEIQKGNRLSLNEAILSEDIVQSAHQLSYDPESHLEWANGVRQRKVEYTRSMTQAARGFEGIAKKRWGLIRCGSSPPS